MKIICPASQEPLDLLELWDFPWERQGLAERAAVALAGTRRVQKTSGGKTPPLTIPVQAPTERSTVSVSS